MNGISGDASFDNEVRLQVYRFFVETGRAPAPVEVADTLDRGPTDVEASLKRLADARVLVLAPGTTYIWMANPLSALPTPYRVEARGRSWFANCIWDAFGVVAMLGADDRAEVHTWCPDCGQGLLVGVTNGSVSLEGESGGGPVHFAVPAAHWWDDIGFT